MPTIHEIQCVAQLIAIIHDESKNDVSKAIAVQIAILSFKEYAIDIAKVVQNFGDVESPVRLSISKSLPKTFGTLHAIGGHMWQFTREQCTANHSFQELINLMAQIPAFCTKGRGQFGYGGELIPSNKDSCTWLHYFKTELGIEIGNERAQAKIAMLDSGMQVPIGQEENLIFSRTKSGTLVCRPGEIPKGNTKQEYMVDPDTGYYSFKLR